MTKFGQTDILLKVGDITKEEIDAIVNAANSGLMGGGGVDGAIHRAGGAEILEACQEIRQTQGTCPTGHAVITTAGKLPTKHVIHTVGPVWRGGKQNEDALLRSCYQISVQLATEAGDTSIAFPSISTGIYGFPIERAAPIALHAVYDAVVNGSSITEVRFVLFSDRDYEIYTHTLEQLLSDNQLP